MQQNSGFSRFCVVVVFVIVWNKFFFRCSSLRVSQSLNCSHVFHSPRFHYIVVNTGFTLFTRICTRKCTNKSIHKLQLNFFPSIWPFRIRMRLSQFLGCALCVCALCARHNMLHIVCVYTAFFPLLLIVCILPRKDEDLRIGTSTQAEREEIKKITTNSLHIYILTQENECYRFGKRQINQDIAIFPGGKPFLTIRIAVCHWSQYWNYGLFRRFFLIV